MKLHWSVKQGGINVETYTKSTCSHQASVLLWLVEWEWLDENLNGWMINGQVSSDALWLHIVPPDYTFRLPKLHLCIWGVNRSVLPVCVFCPCVILPVFMFCPCIMLPMSVFLNYQCLCSAHVGHCQSCANCTPLFSSDLTCMFILRWPYAVARAL